ncbi:MAG: hypothetical protein KGQ93_09760 [Cyanobacteria bacterium REEB459]|nr:hypothetical protein [Cyanobacteria bacterium REEB459]
MKSTLIRIFILPGGISLVMGLSLLSLVIIYASLPQAHLQAASDRNQFPGQRRGGGTHVMFQPGDVV